MDETYIKVSDKWVYLYRAIDKQSDTIDFMLSEKRDCKLALKFLKKAIGLSGLSEKVTIDKSGTNTAALHRLNLLLLLPGFWWYLVEVRLIKYLNKLLSRIIGELSE